MTPKNEFSEKTKLPVSLILTFGAALSAVAVWAGSLETKISASELRQMEQSVKLEKMNDAFHSIDMRLSRIEGALGVTKK